MDYRYTQTTAIEALEKLNKPVNDLELFDQWKRIADLEVVRQIEAMTGIARDDEELSMLIIFRAAIVTLLDDKRMVFNKERLLCLKEWLPDPKRLRTVDDEWAS